MSTSNNNSGAAPSAAPAQAAATTPQAEPVLTGKTILPSLRNGVVKPAIDSRPAKVEAPKPPVGEKKYEIKVNGAVKQVTEAELLRMAQMSEAAQEKFAQAGEARRHAEQVLGFLKSNPAEALKAIGLDPRDFSENYLMQVITREMETPQQRAARMQAEELMHHRAAEKARNDAALKRKKDSETEAMRVKLDGLFTESLKLSGLKATPRVVARMATLAKAVLKSGRPIDADSAKAIAQITREDLSSDLKDLMQGQDPEALEQFLGEDVWKTLSKQKLKKLRASGVKFAKSTTPANEDRRSEKQTASWADFKRRNRGYSGG